ncbi:hypothetical protein MVLG_05501 [Microbotryum lychnidis-dioicae p1A1 Lamole]|uniref:Uncharacterized protein n=1 Tax=Microbotryum lychnidis-dioicae (strain p1A1 Lamole / MvSl-1064) TaxID=683840 RepID=U5HEF7_USTV1|nr:hypothetical protein MVLG_05501 [Microbotryum lychnidis-dioicae p1A1 Lamole]|eukprot:KDE04062.1 hypothetical protein MVLG_05501 [Microbotryum lychnidis-dioicae p1A1 Lamole]
MASLNWVMLSPTRSPIPLPSEKVLHTVPSVSISLFPCPPGSAPNANPTPPSSESKSDKGNLYATNKRVVYVSTVAQEGKGRVDSFSVPWQGFVDGRFVQPWFGANYYEALCLPDPRSTDSGISTPHLSRFYFNEAGGYQFYEICEEMKARIGNSSERGRGTPVEALPLYEPPSSTTSNTTGSGPGPSPLSQLHIDPTTTSTSTSQIDLASPQEPSATDLAVAQVAQQAQLDEAQEAEKDLDRATAPGGSNLSSGSGIGALGVPQRDGGEEDGPPGYEA